jgi:hypothetical protein
MARAGRMRHRIRVHWPGYAERRSSAIRKKAVSKDQDSLLRQAEQGLQSELAIRCFTRLACTETGMRPGSDVEAVSNGLL